MGSFKEKTGIDHSKKQTLSMLTLRETNKLQNDMNKRFWIEEMLKNNDKITEASLEKRRGGGGGGGEEEEEKKVVEVEVEVEEEEEEAPWVVCEDGVGGGDGGSDGGRRRRHVTPNIG
ncbi:hypothetical protein HZH68_015915 [Vespula germanica]|uniref:Uncharacterized protein n=1 Tax=Vespula germanica TaxID=30212 RepID=A0A834J3Y0_VESGE|nr:hypothetical protein HZH68_015915 [Vespula germanica]